MAYPYFTAGSPTYFGNAKDTVRNEFQAMLDAQFYTSTWVNVQEETSVGSGSFAGLDVRVESAIESLSGEKLGDDFKVLLFKSITHDTGLGKLYYFNDNYWIVSHSEVIEALGVSCTVRRCNNMLRWVDVNGKEFSEKCAIDYKVKRPTDSARSRAIVTPEGFIEVMSQGNDRTRTIRDGQRFLFGNTENRIGYRVYGDGVNNFLNQQTLDDDSANVLYFMMGVNYVNDDTDDLTNGIADKYKEAFVLSASPTSFTGNVSDSFQITATLTRNEIPVTKPITYMTSSSPIATVSASGLVSLVATGSCNISASMTNNASASATILTTVSGTPIDQDEIRVSPNPDFILQEDTQTYLVYAWSSGSVQADTFTFVASGSVPVANYALTTINDNSFSIKNEDKYLDAPLIITCTSSESATRRLSIELRGAW